MPHNEDLGDLGAYSKADGDLVYHTKGDEAPYRTGDAIVLVVEGVVQEVGKGSVRVKITQARPEETEPKQEGELSGEEENKKEISPQPRMSQHKRGVGLTVIFGKGEK